MTYKDCGHAVSMNKMCQKPLQSAADILEHMAAHNASDIIAAAGRPVPPELSSRDTDWKLGGGRAPPHRKWNYKGPPAVMPM